MWFFLLLQNYWFSSYYWFSRLSLLLYSAQFCFSSLHSCQRIHGLWAETWQKLFRLFSIFKKINFHFANICTLFHIVSPFLLPVLQSNPPWLLVPDNLAFAKLLWKFYFHLYSTWSQYKGIYLSGRVLKKLTLCRIVMWSYWSLLHMTNSQCMLSCRDLRCFDAQ